MVDIVKKESCCDKGPVGSVDIDLVNGSLRELVEGSWMEINQPQKISGVDDTLLICPFEQEKQQKRIS